MSDDNGGDTDGKDQDTMCDLGQWALSFCYGGFLSDEICPSNIFSAFIITWGVGRAQIRRFEWSSHET